jgi:HTH-type transcriptional regulator/antitoxin MqsA
MMSGSEVRDACVICGGDVRQVQAAHEVRVGQRTVTLESDHRQCVQCGERFFSPDQLDEIQKRAADTVRREEGLLFPWDIRGIRTRLGLTQAQFERLLGAGPKTVVRWEKGTVFQNGATDSLLRVLAALPEAALILARHHGVSLSREGIASAGISEPTQRDKS